MTPCSCHRDGRGREIADSGVEPDSAGAAHGRGYLEGVRHDRRSVIIAGVRTTDIRPPQQGCLGRIAWYDCEHKSCDTANMFCRVKLRAGWRFIKTRADSRSPRSTDFLLKTAARYLEADTFHKVMGNLCSDTRWTVVEWYVEKSAAGCKTGLPRTPKHTLAEASRD